MSESQTALPAPPPDDDLTQAGDTPQNAASTRQLLPALVPWR